MDGPGDDSKKLPASLQDAPKELVQQEAPGGQDHDHDDSAASSERSDTGSRASSHPTSTSVSTPSSDADRERKQTDQKKEGGESGDKPKSSTQQLEPSFDFQWYEDHKVIQLARGDAWPCAAISSPAWKSPLRQRSRVSCAANAREYLVLMCFSLCQTKLPLVVLWSDAKPTQVMEVCGDEVSSLTLLQQGN